MNILAAGDSFTYGDELLDTSNAWPFLLGKKLHSNVVNIAEPAASNYKILRKTMDHVVNYHIKPDLVVIGWTSPGRQEFSDDVGYYDIWPGYSGNLFLKDNTLWRAELTKFISVYHNKEHLYTNYLHQIILLQSFFKQQNIKYLMMDVMAFDYYKTNKTVYTENYFNLIDKNFFIDFNKAGMTEWTYGVPQGPYGHFLDQGHEIVANKVYDYIESLEWI